MKRLIETNLHQTNDQAIRTLLRELNGRDSFSETEVRRICQTAGIEFDDDLAHDRLVHGVRHYRSERIKRLLKTTGSDCIT